MKKLSYVIQWVFSATFLLGALAKGFHWTSLLFLIAAGLMMPIPFIRNILRKYKIKSGLAIAISVICFFVGVTNAPVPEADIPNTSYTSSNTSDSSDKTSMYEVLESADSSPSHESDTANPTCPSAPETIESANAAESSAEQIESVDSPTSSETEEIESVDSPTSSEAEEIEPVDSLSPSETEEVDSIAPPIPSETEESESDDSPTFSEPDEVEETVWIPTNGGKKYHSYPSCSGMKSPKEVTLKEATRRGFTPCKRCR